MYEWRYLTNLYLPELILISCYTIYVPVLCVIFTGVKWKEINKKKKKKIVCSFHLSLYWWSCATMYTLFMNTIYASHSTHVHSYLELFTWTRRNSCYLIFSSAHCGEIKCPTNYSKGDVASKWMCFLCTDPSCQTSLFWQLIG